MGLSEISKENYQELLSISCESVLSPDSRGNRIKAVIKKAQSAPVTFAFLGGSVTLGFSPDGVYEESYPTMFVRLFSEKYGRTGSCTCINAGYSSTNSQLGLVYAETRLRTAEPDVVFVEFAINNGTDKTEVISFESLIYKLLNYECRPVVIPVIICNSEFYTCSSYMELIAKHYGLPDINIYRVLKYGIENGILEWSDYSEDYAHPSIHGHKLIADCILKLFERSESFEEGTLILPEEACFGRDFWPLEYIGNNTLIPAERGRFEPSNSIELFPDGWSYNSNINLPAVFCFTVDCRSLFIIYEINNQMDYGRIEILIDHQPVLQIDGYSIYGWGNPYIRLIIQEEEARLHKIEIKMHKEDRKKRFNLLGFGIVR